MTVKHMTNAAALLALALGFYFLSFGPRLPWQKASAGETPKKEGWCVEHDLPEKECYICNPSLVRAPSAIDVEKPKGAASGAGGETECNSDKIKVRIPASVARSAGIETAPVVKKSVSHAIACTAEVAYDPNRMAKVGPRVGGIAREILKSPGEDVAVGETLLVLDSPELGEAKSDLLQAGAILELRTSAFEREKGLHEKGISSGKDFAEAQTSLQEAKIGLAKARQRLRNLGFSDPGIEQVMADKDSSSQLKVASPLAGTVVERHVVLGETVEPSRVLFEIVDLSRAWALLDVTEKDLPSIEKDQKASLTLPGLPDVVFRGKVRSVGAGVDEKTRTIKVRADVKNVGGLLRQGLFGTGRIIVADNAEALVIPKGAVQWEGCHHIVFVPSTPGTYQVRKVTLGISGGDFYEIKGGIVEGEQVVTTGSFLMKTEILKGTIGAGCTD